jgi:UDP-glucose 4-epimerase
VTAVDDLSHGKREAVPEGAELLVLDVRDPKLMAEMERRRPDAVVHLAAQMDVRKSVADPLWDASINVLGTLSALESARRASVRRFVFASSGGAVYGEQDVFPATESHPRRPASPYGTSKLCGEEYVDYYKRVHGLSTISMRYANVYGPGQDPLGEAGVVAIFLHHLLGGRAPKINGDGLQTRDFVYVEDVARGLVACAERGTPGDVYNLASGVETTIRRLAELIVELSESSSQLEIAPRRPWDHSILRFGSPEKARQELGFEAQTPLEEGLLRTIAWTRERLDWIDECVAKHKPQLAEVS